MLPLASITLLPPGSGNVLLQQICIVESVLDWWNFLDFHFWVTSLGMHMSRKKFFIFFIFGGGDGSDAWNFELEVEQGNTSDAFTLA